MNVFFPVFGPEVLELLFDASSNLKRIMDAHAIKIRNFKKYRQYKYPNWLKYGREFMHLTLACPDGANHVLQKTLKEDILINDLYHTSGSYSSRQQLKGKRNPGPDSTGRVYNILTLMNDTSLMDSIFAKKGEFKLTDVLIDLVYEPRSLEVLPRPIGHTPATKKSETEFKAKRRRGKSLGVQQVTESAENHLSQMLQTKRYRQINYLNQYDHLVFYIYVFEKKS